MTEILIRPLAAADRLDWARLWRGYLAFYETELPAAQYDATFARLLSGDPDDFHGLVAEADGHLVGLAHYLFHRHGWRQDRVCYLQDLYADPQVRGTGVGRALIEAVYAAADKEGAPRVYWLTQDFNATARRLYDRIGRKSAFIRYDRPLP
ncbi:GNAT family N-acetyltransferase [Wenxinia marina]|uniref:N-acetylglutamate synthase n=1 Tax=Wenxinia marina DSM 24838 TaxID=1123501 RepID=A0A0D0PZQ2_9RHOB|nr:GNAT family N-acetyltransferase [Wenxinia marina]KIQ67844.1 N-acetylglutamate synthase [Wenxinia marina DSM 24838]GGL74601.1 GCN5 family N-acetyltransferase [Wenxinia marina]